MEKINLWLKLLKQCDYEVLNVDLTREGFSTKVEFYAVTKENKAEYLKKICASMNDRCSITVLDRGVILTLRC